MRCSATGVSLRDREGKVTTYGYDGDSHRLTTITDARGNVVVTNTYDSEGRVATQKDARGLVTGQQTTFGYVTNGDGSRTTTVTYPATSVDPTWHPTEVDTYDPLGRLVSRASRPTADPNDEAVQQYTYDADFNVTSARDPRGNVTDFCYDVDYSGAPIGTSRGNLTRRIDPAPTPGANRPVTLYKHDAKDNVIQVIPPKGVSSGPTVTCSTDLSGSLNLLYATDSAYDAATQTKLESVTRRYTDPELGQRTAVTKFEYGDPANPGRVTRIIPPRGNTGGTPDYSFATTYTYYGPGPKAGMLKSVDDPLGNKTAYDYDAVGRRTTMVDPNGYAMLDDDGGNPVLVGVPAEHAWEYIFDNEDRLRFAKAPAPQPGGSQLVTEYRYDAVGNREVVVDPNGQVTKYVYDERDNLARVQESPSAWTDPSVTPSPLFLTEYQYDNAGNLSRVTRAKGDANHERAVDYTYDGLDRLRKETQYPNWPETTGTLVSQYAYDRNGNRLTATDPLGQTTTFGYDALNRLTAVAYSDGVTPSVTYGYDPNGNRSGVADGTGPTTYTYDELDRLLSVTSPGPKAVGYRYDLDGNRTKVTYPDGTAVTYSFDKASRPESLLDWASRSTSYQYYPDGNLKGVVNHNGTSAQYVYDNALRLRDVSNVRGGGTTNRHTYALDKAGNRQGVDEVLGEPGGLKPDTPWTWGNNYDGQLGDGTLRSRYTPGLVTGLHNVTAVAAGGHHAVALKADGTVWAWGRNFYGQVGDGTNTERHIPVQVSGLTDVVAVAAGEYHSLALKRDGTVWAWGRNDSGQLGDGSTTHRAAPVQVPGVTNVVGIAAGWYHSLAVKADGTVWGWGYNGWGTLCTVFGGGSTPTQIGGLTGVRAAAGGSDHSLFLKSDGTVWGCGSNSNGQLGDNSTTNRTSPVRASGLTGVTSIAAGDSHSLALKADGTVWAWGANDFGQLGTGNTRDRKTPGQVSGLSGVTLVGAGYWESLAVKGDGSLWAWGNTQYGSGTMEYDTPIQIPGPTAVSSVAGGWLYTIASPQPSQQLTTSYGYDGLYRLSSANSPSGTTTYEYDPVGNRKTMTRGSATSYTYDRADRIQSAGSVAYTVNANGNLVARGSDTLTYDQANRLKGVTIGGATSSYTYDGDGKRASKTVGGVTTSYVYDVNASLPVVLDGGSRKYVWGLGLAYAVDTAGGVQVYHTDGLGSVRAITDGTGSVVQTYQTDEFGVPTQSQGSVSQPFQYTGEQRDAESGFYYLRARYYDPTTGRFTSSDPLIGTISVPCTLNRSVYALNNPLTVVDPSGMKNRVLRPTDDFIEPIKCLGVDFLAYEAGLVAFTAVSNAGFVVGAAVGEAIDPVGGAVPGALAGLALGVAAGLYAGNKVAVYIHDVTGCPWNGPRL